MSTPRRQLRHLYSSCRNHGNATSLAQYGFHNRLVEPKYARDVTLDWADISSRLSTRLMAHVTMRLH
jgi:hypothetical protein